MREGGTGLEGYEKAGRKRTEQECAVINMINIILHLAKVT